MTPTPPSSFSGEFQLKKNMMMLSALLLFTSIIGHAQDKPNYDPATKSINWAAVIACGDSTHAEGFDPTFGFRCQTIAGGGGGLPSGLKSQVPGWLANGTTVIPFTPSHYSGALLGLSPSLPDNCSAMFTAVTGAMAIVQAVGGSFLDLPLGGETTLASCDLPIAGNVIIHGTGALAFFSSTAGTGIPSPISSGLLLTNPGSQATPLITCLERGHCGLDNVIVRTTTNRLMMKYTCSIPWLDNVAFVGETRASGSPTCAAGGACPDNTGVQFGNLGVVSSVCSDSTQGFSGYGNAHIKNVFMKNMQYWAKVFDNTNGITADFHGDYTDANIGGPAVLINATVTSAYHDTIALTIEQAPNGDAAHCNYDSGFQLDFNATQNALTAETSDIGNCTRVIYVSDISSQRNDFTVLHPGMATPVVMPSNTANTIHDLYNLTETVRNLKVSTITCVGTAWCFGNANANTVFGNFTGSAGTPINNPMTPCGGDGTHALGWVAGSGFNCTTISVATPTIGGIIGGYDGVANSAGSHWSFFGAANTNSTMPLPFEAYIAKPSVWVSANSAFSSSSQFGIAQYLDSLSPQNIPLSTWTVNNPVAATGYQASTNVIPTFIPQAMPIAFLAGGPNTPGAVVRGFAARTIGSSSQWLGVSLNTDTVPGSSTRYTGPSQGVTLNATENLMEVPIPYGGTAKNLCVNFVNSQPAGGAITITVDLNEVPTTLTVNQAASGFAGVVCDTTHTFSVVAGDRIDFSMVNASGSTSAQVSGIGLEFSPTSPPANGKGIVVFGSGAAALVATNYASPFTNRSAADTSSRAPIPSNATLKNLYCFATTAPLVNPFGFTLVQTGTPTALTISMATGTSVPGNVSDTTHTVSFTELQAFDLLYSQTAGTVPAISACSLEVDWVN